MQVPISESRFRETFDHFCSIGGTEDGGLTRVSMSDANVEARDELVRILQDSGFEVTIDRVGNIFGKRPGSDDSAAPVIIGSHLDSVPYGGCYDGQLGVLTALEALLAIEDAGIDTKRPIWLVNWTSEEGSRFDAGLIGSSGFTGRKDVEDLLDAQDPDGITLREELERTGYDGDEMLNPNSVDSYLELHIEQGPVLEQTDTTIGISEGIWGTNGLEIFIHGKADHAGTTPMYDRADPVTAASAAMQNIAQVPGRIREQIVTTIGEIDLHPGASNVIPSYVRFTVDMRSPSRDALEAGKSNIKQELEAACDREGVEYEINSRGARDFLGFSDRVQSAIEKGTKATGTSWRYMTNGAGHDAGAMQEITDAGLMFVPSVDGISHNESELTEWEDCVAGAEVFAETTVELATDD